MNKDTKKLGRGLSSLFSSGNVKDDDLDTKLFKLINTSSIIANSQQPRKKFGKNELEELAASIKFQGILQPIVVRKKDENIFEIIAGERRWRAAQIAGIHEIPAFIKEILNSIDGISISSKCSVTIFSNNFNVTSLDFVSVLHESFSSVFI